MVAAVCGRPALSPHATVRIAMRRPHTLRQTALRPQGVPAYLRHKVWFDNSGAAAKRAAHGHKHFEECVRAALSSPNQSHVRQIDLDVGRTYPEHPFFRGEEGLGKLRTVLLAYAGHNPEVGYCQSMNYVAGLLLLVLDRDPEDSFWVLAALVEGASRTAGPKSDSNQQDDSVAQRLPSSGLCSDFCVSCIEQSRQMPQLQASLTTRLQIGWHAIRTMSA